SRRGARKNRVFHPRSTTSIAVLSPRNEAWSRRLARELNPCVRDDVPPPRRVRDHREADRQLARAFGAEPARPRPGEPLARALGATPGEAREPLRHGAGDDPHHAAPPVGEEPLRPGAGGLRQTPDAPIG